MTNAILEWENELQRSFYPLTTDIGLKDVLVDASFQQFDNFIPSIRKIIVFNDRIIIDVLTDEGIIKLTVDKTDVLGNVKSLNTTTRHLGYVVVGNNVQNYIGNNIGRTITHNVEFSSNVVRSINSSSGVFSINKARGDYSESAAQPGVVELFTDIFIFFENAGQTLTWNAMAYPTRLQDITPLKKLNGISGINNSSFIEETELIKIKKINNGLSFELANSVLNNTISHTE